MDKVNTACRARAWPSAWNATLRFAGGCRAARSRNRGALTRVLAGLTLAAVVIAIPMSVAAPHLSASAVPTGGPVKTLANHGVTPAVVVDRLGTVTAVWSGQSLPDQPLDGPIRASRHRVGGGWTQPMTIGVGSAPQIGVDAEGAVTVVWENNRDEFTAGVRAARRPPGGPWQPPVRLSRDVAAPGYHPSPDMDEGAYGAHRLDLAVSPRGGALVAWQWGSDHRNVPYRIETIHRPAAGPWGQRVQLTPGDWSSRPSVGVAGEGLGIVTYESPEDGSTVARRRLTTGQWAPEEVLIARETAGHEVLMDPVGNATLLADDFTQVLARRHPVGGSWTPVTQVSPGRLTDPAEAVVDRFGAVSVAVLRGNAAPQDLEVVRRPAAGPWGAPASIGSTGADWDVSLSANFAGDLLVAWPSPGTSLMARNRPSGSGWTRPFTVLGPDGFYSDVASAASKRRGGVLAWQRGFEKVQARIVR